MKLRFFKQLFFLFFAITLAAITFLYWSSSSLLSSDRYTQTIRYETPFQPADSSFSIITYNMGYLSGMTNNTSQQRNQTIFDEHLNNVKKVFGQYQADFIALQEIDFGAHRSFEVNQLEALANSLAFPNAAMAVNWDKQYVPFPYFPPSQHFGKMLSGQAILSKFPIQIHDRIVLTRPDNPIWYDLFYLERLAQIATIQLNGEQLIIINVHLEAFNKETRQQQSEAVLALYRNYAKHHPTLLVGDFNSAPIAAKQPTIDLFLNEPGLVTACPKTEFNQAHSLTYPSDAPSEQIDYIFYHQDQFELLSWKVLKEVETASDHLPVFMTFKLK